MWENGLIGEAREMLTDVRTSATVSHRGAAKGAAAAARYLALSVPAPPGGVDACERSAIRSRIRCQTIISRATPIRSRGERGGSVRRIGRLWVQGERNAKKRRKKKGGEDR